MGSRGGLQSGWGRARRGAAGAARRPRQKEEEQRELPLLPAGCPVKPLGKLGQLCFYLDEQGQMIASTRATTARRTSSRCSAGGAAWSTNIGRATASPTRKRASRPSPAGCPRKRPRSCRRRARMPGCSTRRARSAAAAPGAGPTASSSSTTATRSIAPAPRLGFAWEEPDLIDGYVYPTAPAMPRPDIGQVDDGRACFCCAAALLVLGAAEDRSLSAARLHRPCAVRRRLDWRSRTCG
jgi:hypothetical protein